MSKRNYIPICITLFVVTTFLFAGVPQLINYQAYLTNAGGNPEVGPRSITYSIYDAPTGGSVVWTETKVDTVKIGYLNTMLGSATPVPQSVFNGSARYLAVKVGIDPEMTPRKQLVSVGYAFQASYADTLGGYGAADYVRTVDGVRPVPATGNVDLVAGSNVTITPGANKITISATGGGGSADNLGNHSATQNIKLNGNWLSNDGGSEGVSVDNSGGVTASRSLVTGTPSTSYSIGDIVADDDVHADDYVNAGNGVIAANNISSKNGHIRTGTPSVSYADGDIASTGNVVADGHILTGAPSSPYVGADIASTDDVFADDDIVAGDDVSAENDVIAKNGYIRTGTPSSSYSAGDIASTDDIYADDRIESGGNIYAGVDLISKDDLAVYDHACINRTTISTSYALYVNGSAWATGLWLGSDLKFKKNITTLDNALETILQLNSKNFDWKTEEYPDMDFNKDKQFGLIAQDVEQLIPEVVKTDDEGNKAVNYIQLIPFLIEAIKTQQKMIEDLQAQVNQ